MTTWISTHDEDAIRWLTLDRPERKNAIPREGWGELAVACREFEESDQRVLIMVGAGEDFCAGADLSTMGFLGGAIDRHRSLKEVGGAVLALHRLSKPTIAAVDGVAVGAGMNLALGCDVVVATSRARFAELFIRRGLTVDSGGTWLLPRIVGLQRAKELALSGRMVEADEARQLGICIEVVEPDQLRARATEIATGFLAGAPVAQMLTKQAIDRSWDVSFEESLGWEGQSQVICFATEDAEEGVRAFLEKRPPRWMGR